MGADGVLTRAGLVQGQASKLLEAHPAKSPLAVSEPLTGESSSVGTSDAPNSAVP